MANAQLAKSIFARKPDEETIVADVYQKTTPEAVNSYQDITGTSTDLYDQFSFLSKFTSGQKLAGPTNEAAASLKDQLDGSLPSTASKAKSLIGDTLKSVKSAAGMVKSAGNALKTATQAYAQVDGLVKAVKSGNLKDLRGITNTLNAITGKTSVLLSPNGSLGKIYGQVVDQASMAGISNSFGIVAGAVRDSTTLANKGNVLYNMASTSLPGALKRGDYLSVSSMADHLGTGVVGMMDSSAVKKLTANTKVAVPGTQTLGQFYEYQGAYSKIDPNWNKSSFQPAGSSTSMNDLTCLMGASKETKDLFSNGAKMSNDPSTRWYAAVDAFPEPKTVTESIKSRYPMSTASSASNAILRDADPRIDMEQAKREILANSDKNAILSNSDKNAILSNPDKGSILSGLDKEGILTGGSGDFW
jgi:hypothetical protein